jgi:uncharacterized protein involved in type VI secretion and phage assembly
MLWIPEVNDEVLIAFEHGDVHRPFVMGALWNGQDASPKKSSEAVDSGSSAVNLRVMKSRSGHTITLDDTQGKENTTILSKSGHTIKLDDTTGTENTTITSKSGHVIKLDDPGGNETVTIKDKSGNNSFVIETTSNKITITAMGNIELNATQDVNITGMNISIQANNQVTVEGTTSATLQGASTSVTGEESVSVTGVDISISGASISLGPG